MKFVFIDPQGVWEGLNNGLASMAALLKSAGHSVRVIDFVNRSGDESARLAACKGADFIGVSLKSFTLDDGLRLAAMAKEIEPAAKLVAGGPHVMIDGVNLLKENPIFDLGIKGEGESVVLALASGKPFPEVPGVLYRSGAEIRETPKADWITDLDSLPFPDYDDFDSFQGKPSVDNWPLVTSRGCPYTCTYCFPAGTLVHSDSGLVPIEQFYSYYENPVNVLTSRGFQPVTSFFERQYKGRLVRIKAAKLPPVSATPNHKLMVMRGGERKFVMTGAIKKGDFIEVPLPVQQAVSFIDVRHEIGEPVFEYEYSRKVPYELVDKAVELHESGISTRQIAAQTGLSKSYVHWIVSNVHEEKKVVENSLVSENGRLKFRLSKSSGLPEKLQLSPNICRLFGYYLAEGSVVKSKSRPNSYSISWTFSRNEVEYAEDVKSIILDELGLKAHEVMQESVRRVYVSDSVLGLLFLKLFGKSAGVKRIPQSLMSMEPVLLEQLLVGWLRGDGGTVKLKDRKNGLMVKATTVSPSLAYQFFLLSYRLGLSPSLQKNRTVKSFIDGREICGSEFNYHLNFKSNTDVAKLAADFGKSASGAAGKPLHFIQDNSLFLPVAEISEEDFIGTVYNLEVDVTHDYTANGFLVSNCSVPYVIGRKFRTRSAENIIAELKYAKEHYHAREFKVLDDNFTLLMDRAKDMCRAFIEAGIHRDFRWSCPNGIRADRLDPELLSLMRDAGCYSVSIGVESGDPEVFDKIRKGERLSDVERGIRMAKSAGLEVHGFFILGLIGSTYESDKRSMEFAKRVGLDSASWGILIPYPGTTVWDEVRSLAEAGEATVHQDWKKGFHIGARPKPVFDTPEYPADERVRAFYKANMKFLKRRDIPKAAKLVVKSLLKGK